MILGRVCTRRRPLTDLAHGRPLPVDPSEPGHLAEAIKTMGLDYVVITSVDRDDLPDGGAAHFVECIEAARAARPGIQVEILTPDFRGRVNWALDVLATTPPDVFNHNLETVARLYPQARPGAEYRGSLELLRRFSERCPAVPIKSGFMVGLGETLDEVRGTMRDLRAHGCRMLTIGQYHPPSQAYLPLKRYVTPEEFDGLGAYGVHIGFDHVESGPLVRPSYHADAAAEFYAMTGEVSSG